MHHTESHQRHIDQALFAQQRNPRNHANDVRGPERHGAEQEQADREQRVADVKDKEIRYPEPDDHGEQPGQHRELDGLGVQVECQRPRKDIDVVLQRRICDQAAKAIALEKASRKHHQDRRHEERQQHQQQRRYVEPTENTFACGHDVAFSLNLRTELKMQSKKRAGRGPSTRARVTRP